MRRIPVRLICKALSFENGNSLKTGMGIIIIK
jgi:hypothetical protein